MNTLAESSKVPVDSRLHWHFRAMPPEIQRSAIRRLALSGIADKDIAAQIGWPLDSVRRAISEDECIRHLMQKSGNESPAIFGWRRADLFPISKVKL